MITASDSAAVLFSQGFNCAQSVLASGSDSSGLSRELALRVAGAFGGGMGCLGETCGAVTGALMAIGLKHAATDPADLAGKQRCYRLARQFIAEFKQRHGSATCRELLACDISTPEGLQRAKDSGLLTTICPALVKDAAQILDQLLAAPSTPATPAP